MVTCMVGILQLVLFVLFLKALVYVLDITDRAVNKVYEKITNKLEEM